MIKLAAVKDVVGARERKVRQSIKRWRVERGRKHNEHFSFAGSSAIKVSSQVCCAAHQSRYVHNIILCNIQLMQMQDTKMPDGTTLKSRNMKYLKTRYSSAQFYTDNPYVSSVLSAGVSSFLSNNVHCTVVSCPCIV